MNNKNNIVSSNKFTGHVWKAIEKVLPEIDIKRNKILCDLGKDIYNDNYTEQIKLITMGENYYLKIRDEIKKYIKLPLIETNKNKNKKKINKKIQITLDNSYVSIKNILNNLINTFFEKKNIKLDYEEIIKSMHFIEFRLIILMKYIDYYVKNYKKVETRDIKEILIASKKILYNLRKNKDNFKKIFYLENYEIQLSEYVINDFETKINELNKKCEFSLYEIANEYPKLIFDTKYDTTIPEIKLKPYNTQVELINKIKENFENGFMINLRVLTGLGKTSSIISICKYIKNLNNPNIKIIFACSDLLNTVRMQVAKLMYNFDVKFGIGIGNLSEDSYKISKIMENIFDSNEKKISVDKLPSYNIITSYKCGKTTKSNTNEQHQQKKLDVCEMIICDYITTYLLLKENKYEYILFFDEPTIKIDDTIVSFYLSQILYHSPKRIILSSATLPLQSEIDNYLAFFKNKYKEANICDISSNKVLVGCVIKDFNNNTITPHINCKTKLELKKFIKKIENYPLLGKFYTLTFLINLNKFLIKYNLHIEIDKIESFDQENILENIMKLMNIVCDNDIVDFDEFINIKCIDINENKMNKNKLHDNYHTIIHEELLTKQAFKFFGCCLISVDDPEKYVKDNFSNLIKKLKEKTNILNVSKMYDEYIEKIQNINKEIENIEKTMKEDNDGIKEEKIKKIHNKIPNFPFPNKLQINTEEHISQFSNFIENYDKSLLKQKLDCKNININDYLITDDIKFLLYMGVGLYCKNLDQDYCNLVLDLLNERKIAFIIADDSFCYGANYAISSVIINDSIGNKNTINTILQLIGRTGRVGKSEIGQVYLDENTLNRIINFFNDDNDNDEEGKTINDNFEIIQNYNLDQNKKINIQTEKIKKEKEKREKEKKEIEEKEKIEKEKKEKEIKEKKEEQERKMKEKWERNKNEEAFFKNNETIKDFWCKTKNENKKEKNKSNIFGDNHNKTLTEEQKKFREKFM